MRLLNRLRSMLAATLAIACFASLAAAADSPKPAQTRVVCFGDSITNRGYPAILGNLLGVDAINAGVGGNTTAKALRRLETDVLAKRPDIVVILFGTNDSRIDNAKVYVPIDAYAANLKRMIAACQQIGASVVLCTVPPIEEDAYFTRHEREPFEAAGGLAELLQLYRSAVIKIADTENLPLMDLNQLLADEPKWLHKDGVHPSKAGNAIIAKHVAAVVGPIVERNVPSQQHPR